MSIGFARILEKINTDRFTNDCHFLLFHLQEGENVAKLEKADILELTVRHLHQLRRTNTLGTRNESSYAEKFKAGFRHCAAEISTCLGVVDQSTQAQILNHLNSCMTKIDRNQHHNPYAGNRVSPPMHARPAIQVQSPNQINAHVNGGPIRVPAQFGDARMHMQRPENFSESSTRFNTPPLSPKVDIDDASVWRPW